MDQHCFKTMYNFFVIHALTIIEYANSSKLYSVAQIKGVLNLVELKYCLFDLKVRAIYRIAQFLHCGGVALRIPNIYS